MKKSILVTGGSGFIGSHLCEKLLAGGNHVVCLDNFLTGSMENIRHLMENKEFELVRCDIMEKAKMMKVFKNGVDLVFHEAAVVGVKLTMEKPKLVLDANITGTRNVLDCALDSGCKKFVSASSSEVYGEPVEIPEKEDNVLNAKLPYAVAKLTGEKYCRAYYDEHGLNTTSLRYFNVYGPRQNSTPYGFVVGIFIQRALEGKPPVIFGDGTQTRDFTYIDDCIKATILASKSNKAEGEYLNIGTGVRVEIKDLAERIIGMSSKNLKPEFAPEREHEIRHRQADITKMKKILGFLPRFDLNRGLKLTMDWYSENPPKK